MSTDAPSREELLALVQAFRKERETHRRAAAGTHARDVADRRMRAIDTSFERTLRTWAVDERLRRAWRDAMHHDAPFPLRPAALSPVVFRGRSDADSEAVVRLAPDGTFAAWVDGGQVDRLVGGLDLQESGGVARLRVGGQLYEERTVVPREALDALRSWVADPSGEPPWRFARALVQDGLVDANFSLTTRGRRLVRARVPEMA